MNFPVEIRRTKQEGIPLFESHIMYSPVLLQVMNIKFETTAFFRGHPVRGSVHVLELLQTSGPPEEYHHLRYNAL
jgi:hypothetical protein